MKINPEAFSNEELTAFLDGEADDALHGRISAALQNDTAVVARVAALQAAVPALRGAFDLDALHAPEMPGHLLTPPRPAGPMIIKATALAASFALGAVVMTTLRPTPDWVDQVASYQALYVAETLAGDGQDSAATQNAFAFAQTALGLQITGAPDIDGMRFKRAQILAIDGQPLIQLAYLGDDGTPFALCITRVPDADMSLSAMTSHSLAAATWVENGLGFVLVGGSDSAGLMALAQDLPQML